MSSDLKNILPSEDQDDILSLTEELDKLNNISKEDMAQLEDILELEPQPEEEEAHVQEQEGSGPSPLLTAHSQLTADYIDETVLSPKSIPVQQISKPTEAKQDPMEEFKAPTEFTYDTARMGPMSPGRESTRSTFSESTTPARKLSDAFSWLSRKATISVKTSPSNSPSLGPGHTAMPVMSPDAISYHSEMGEEKPVKRRAPSFSLQERFKLVRMRQDTGLSLLEHRDDSSSSEASGSRGTSVEPSPIQEEFLGQAKQQQPDGSEDTITPLGGGPVTHDAEGPVDWDLWQQVVYEGPAAVARQSPDELSQAISRGIPSAIRGVVWQVLAQSKNEDLETVYRELVARQAHPEPRQRSMSGLNIRLPSFRSQESSPVRRSRSQRKGSVSSLASSIRSSETSRSRASSIQHGLAGQSPSVTSIDEAAATRIQESIDEQDNKAREASAALMKLEKSIRRDLGARTSYSKFLMSAGLQDGLFGVCKAYALFDESIGYAQGMNFIAMPLLFNMPEEEAFCMFVKLMNQYKLRDMFIEGMPGLHLHLYQFERLLEDLEPAIYCHLNRRGVTPQLYATQWFLTLFAYRFPLQLVVRIYDLILSEGLEGAILKFGLALMRKNANKILDIKDMAVLSSFLKEGLFDAYIDKSPSATSILESGFFGRAGGVDKQVYRADELVVDACAVKITPEDLERYKSEWEQKCQDENTKEAEDAALRASNASLLLQVKSLSERVEKADVDHVQVASELVRVKVENDRVHDEVEGLREQVQELRNIIQSQPHEVESKLKEEMDRIMKRNIEVHEENRCLEDSLADMEKELVNAKIQNAEVSGELDNMRQKWNTVSSMLGNKA